MAKKVKFQLEMSNGEQVRTIDELKENFDIEKVIGYFNDGRLLRWLKDRYYDEEADKVSALSKDEPQLQKKLCDIFGVETETEEVDVEEIADRIRRLNLLKQYTNNPEILERVDLVAFNQEDLGDLLDDDKPLIYLCHNQFVIPLRETHKTYIGIGKAVAIIRSKEIVDFDNLNIKFENVKFDDTYNKIFKAQESFTQKKNEEEKAVRLFDEATDAYDDGDYEIALRKFKESAELGNLQAINKLGFLYFEGKVVKKDMEEARRWLKRGMDKNDGDCFGAYAFNIINDDSARYEYEEEAVQCMKKAVELSPKNGLWQRCLGDMYYNGMGTFKDVESAVKYYEKSLQFSPNSKVANLIGAIYRNNEYIHSDYNKAFEFFNKAVEFDNENTLALKNLADCYWQGKGVMKNDKKAFSIYRKAAELGDTVAMYYAGFLILYGEDVPKDYDLAFELIKKAADDGVYMAKEDLATCYRNGLGTPKNIHKALDYYLETLDESDSDKLVELGNIYSDEESVRDPVKAKYYYEKAANLGSGYAMWCIGLMYDFGDGVAEDKQTAFQYYLASARAGDVDGMAMVGKCYHLGSGTSKNYTEAERWLKKSAEGGSITGMERYADYLEEQDEDYQACHWYKNAVDAGSGEAAYKFYEIFKYGLCGMPQDERKAEYWLQKSQELGAC